MEQKEIVISDKLHSALFVIAGYMDWMVGTSGWNLSCGVKEEDKEEFHEFYNYHIDANKTLEVFRKIKTTIGGEENIRSKDTDIELAKFKLYQKINGQALKNIVNGNLSGACEVMAEVIPHLKFFK